VGRGLGVHIGSLWEDGSRELAEIFQAMWAGRTVGGSGEVDSQSSSSSH
jgi:hypothetical protein